LLLLWCSSVGRARCW